MVLFSGYADKEEVETPESTESDGRRGGLVAGCTSPTSLTSSTDNLPTAASCTLYCGCSGMIEGQYIAPRKPDPTPQQIASRKGWRKLLPVAVWRECVYRRPQKVGFALPFFWTLCWWAPVMSATGFYTAFGKGDPSIGARKGWPFALMMLFGSLVAGGTSEGGGAVAYPVMTLIFGLSSYIARDFSLMIQSVGMTAAAFSILYAEIRIEMNAVVWANIGGIFGCVIGVLFVAPHIPGDLSKMLFVGVWSTFALSLFLLNRESGRPVFLDIPLFDGTKRIILLAAGVIGGFFSSIAGSGIDIMNFAVLTLLFRVSEKTATPTSVVLMGCNTVVGFLTQLLISPYVLSREVQARILETPESFQTECSDWWEGGCIAPQTWRYFLCAAIVVPVGAPLGAFISSFFARHVYAYILYAFNFVQLVTAFLIVHQTADTGIVFCSAVACAGFSFFAFFKLGDRWLDAALDRSSTVALGEKKKEGRSEVLDDDGAVTVC